MQLYAETCLFCPPYHREYSQPKVIYNMIIIIQTRKTITIEFSSNRTVLKIISLSIAFTNTSADAFFTGNSRCSMKKFSISVGQDVETSYEE